MSVQQYAGPIEVQYADLKRIPHVGKYDPGGP